MDIKILGSGCSRCKKLHKTVAKLVKKNSIDAEIEYLTDMEAITKLGIESLPAIIIDDEIKVQGAIPSKKQLLAWLAP